MPDTSLSSDVVVHKSADRNAALEPSLLSTRTVALVLLACLVLWITGQRVEVGRMAVLTAQGLAAAVGFREHSQVSAGLGKIVTSMVPLQLAERSEISRIEGFDPSRLPPFTHLETVEERAPHLNPATLTMEETVERKTYLVEPFGYVAHVSAKMLETLEIALWGTILAALISAPLAFYGARNYAPNSVVYGSCRAVVSFFRAVPELISALFLVLAYGFGPIAGVLALAIHSAGFLGKFFAEDIENADDKPQEALRAIGANKIKVFLYAVMPQVAPQYIAYAFYIFDRNMRMAAVIGLVGAGGIGQELKGRYDMYNYHHVGTILVAIFLAVFALDQISARVRARYL